MRGDRKFQQFFEDPNRDRLKTKESLGLQESELPQGDKIPSGYDPMGIAHLEGRAYGSFSKVNTPWWVIISGWIIFGFVSFVMLGVVLESIEALVAQKLDINNLPVAAIAYIPLLFGLLIYGAIFFSLWRGTKAKLARKQRH
jgi:hypothetical protein